jgi:hypothetical protein
VLAALMAILPILKLALFCIIDSWAQSHGVIGGISRTLCLCGPAPSFTCDRGYTIYHMLKLSDSQFENAKIKVKNAKLWNPDVVGITVLIMVLCFITIYHITVCVDSWE